LQLLIGPPAMRRIEQLADADRGNRPAEQVSLGFGHRAVGADQFELLVGLDALDHDRHAEVRRQPRHAAQQPQRVRSNPPCNLFFLYFLLQMAIVKTNK